MSTKIKRRFSPNTLYNMFICTLHYKVLSIFLSTFILNGTLIFVNIIFFLLIVIITVLVSFIAALVVVFFIFFTFTVIIVFILGIFIFLNFLLSFSLRKRFDIVGNIIKSICHGQMNQDPGCSLTISVPADGAVTEVPTRRTLPMRILKSLTGILAVAVPQTASAELTPNP